MDWVDTIAEKVTESVKQVITEEAVDATTACVHAAFPPANVEMLTLAGLAAERAPPGSILERGLDRLPLTPEQDKSAPVTAHANVRGPEYYRQEEGLS